MKSQLLILALWCTTMSATFAQRVLTDLYQYHYTVISPVFAGLDGERVTFIGSSFRPGQSGGETALGFVGYERPLAKINSGIGVNVDVWQRGQRYSVAGSYINLLYNYQFKIDERQKLILGAKLSHYEFSYGVPSFIPEVDETDYASKKSFVAGVGVLYKRDKFFLGISADNLTRNAWVDTSRFTSRKLMVHYFTGMNFNISEKLSSEHSAYLYYFAFTSRLDINSALVVKRRTIWGLTMRIENGEFVPLINYGLRFKDRGQFVMVLYSKEHDVTRRFSAQVMASLKI